VRICCCCVDKKSYKEKLFHGRWLKVDQAIEPSLILWENLGVSRKNRCLRILGRIIISIILVIATTTFILYVKIYEDDLKPAKVDCTQFQNITREGAYQS